MRKVEACWNWVVSAGETGMTLLAFLRKACVQAPSVKALKRAIDGKLCTVDGRIEVFSSHPLKQGARVALDPVAFRPQSKQLSLSILYEDPDLLICHKPAGFMSESRLFNQALPAYHNGLLLVHRLDKETSGVIILAKNKLMKEKMIELFAERSIEKTYLAIVDGVVEKLKGVIDQAIGQKAEYQGQTIYQVVGKERGKSAITSWQRVQTGKSATLLSCYPLTGRTHQIRVHLSAMGHPILGDAQYAARFRSKLRPKRHMLHAYRIVFTDPRNPSKQIDVIAPIPSDFKECLNDACGPAS